MKTLAFLCAALAPLLARADPLDVYAQLTGKTVLMPSALPALPDAIIPEPLTDKTNAVATIERAFAEKGIEVVQDGPHFVRLFRGNSRAILTNAPLRGAALAAASNAVTAPAPDQGMLPEGMIDFTGADINQVLQIYALMSQRTILRPAVLPAPTIRLKTSCPLSKEEGLYAFSTVLALNRVCVVEDGPKFVQVVPMEERARVKARAPKPEPGAKLLDPNKVPSTGITVSVRPRNEMERLEQEFEKLQKALCDFMHMAQPAKDSGQRLLELYARLADKTAVASTNTSRPLIYFHVVTPLTRSELLYAIETTLVLNNLAIIPVDDRRIRLIEEGRRAHLPAKHAKAREKAPSNELKQRPPDR
jgi:hypothetical protein